MERLLDRLRRLLLHPSFAALFALSMVCVASFITYCPLGGPPKWDASVYDGLIRAYVDSGHDVAAFAKYAKEHPDTWSWRFSIISRPLYVWAVAGAHAATGIPIAFVYGFLNFVTFSLSAIVLFFIAKDHFGVGPMAAAFCGSWLVLLPPVLLIYEAQTHSDGVVLLMTALCVLAYLKGWLRTSAVFLGLGILAKETTVLLPMYFVLRELFAPEGREPKRMVRLVAVMGAASVVALAIRTSWVASTGMNQWPAFATAGLDVFRHVATNGFGYFLHQFGVLWLPFVLALALEPKESRAAAGWYVLAMTPSLIISTDWYRILYVPLFFVVLPLAAKHLERVGAGSRFLGPAGMLLVTTVLVLRHGAFDRWQEFPAVPYLAMAGLLFAAHVGRQLAPAPGPDTPAA